MNQLFLYPVISACRLLIGVEFLYAVISGCRLMKISFSSHGSLAGCDYYMMIISLHRSSYLFWDNVVTDKNPNP